MDDVGGVACPQAPSLRHRPGHAVPGTWCSDCSVEPEPPASTSWKADRARKDVKHGPFSEAEQDSIREEVQQYAAAHALDPENLEWLFIKGKTSKGAITAIAEKVSARDIGAGAAKAEEVGRVPRTLGQD